MHHTDHIIPDQPRPLPESGVLYFVGIGGAGMSAIAQVLAERGRVVVGADPGIAPAVKERLEKAGATVFTKHDAGQIGTHVSAVITSDAIPPANPEVIAAKKRGIPLYRRPEVLGAIVNAGRGIAIAGTHGKTTTTGMVASILIHAGLDPTVLIGGDLPLIGGNARNGKGEFVVAESCEAYDGFLYLHPEVAVILNIEADHLDYHGDEAHVIASFERFVRQIKPGGTLIACGEDSAANRMLKVKGERGGGFTYGGLTRSAYLEAKRVELSPLPVFTLVWDYDTPEVLGHVSLKVPGAHNVLNALAAASVASTIGVAPEHIIAGLESFTGTGRRFERLGEASAITVIDDYAHHPTELRATLAAARSAFPERRIVAVFQPHLPSRTRDLMNEFAAALAGADAVYLSDIYLAREQPIPGVSSQTLAERIAALPDAPPVVYVADKEDLPARIQRNSQFGDVVLTLGAGNIRTVGEEFLKRITVRGNRWE